MMKWCLSLQNDTRQNGSHPSTDVDAWNPASHCVGIQKHWRHKPVAERLAVGYGGQFQLNGRPHNPTPWFRPPPASVVTAESFSNGSGPLQLQCVPQEMGFHWQRTMWLRWNPNSVAYRQLLSTDQVRRRTTAPTWSRRGGRQLLTTWLLAYDNNNEVEQQSWEWLHSSTWSLFEFNHRGSCRQPCTEQQMKNARRLDVRIPWKEIFDGTLTISVFFISV